MKKFVSLPAPIVAAILACSAPLWAQTQITISMAAPPATPRILGAAIAGIVPRTPFLHTIAASGQRPMTFTASGLPPGLAVDANTGRITGTVDTPGQYVVTLGATNAVGSATETLTIVAGDTLALTPPVGWNSYDSFDDSVNEAEFLAQAQWQADHLSAFGWQYAVVDFRWYDPGAPGSNQNQSGVNMNLVMDANGRFQPDPVRFPSSAGGVGFRALADKVHAMGLKFGIHIMRGIPRRAYQANSPILGSSFTATNAADTTSPCPWNSDMYGVRIDADAGASAGQAWYDSIFQQYAAWEIDFVKVDDMVKNDVNPGLYHQAEVQAIATAIGGSGRSIVLSLSPGEMPLTSAAHLQAHANMWRMSNDFWDRPADLDHIFTLANSWQGNGGPGHWPDADMLPLGSLSPRCPVDGNHTTRFTHNEQVTMMTLWAILPSPLMLGANMTALGNDAWTTALLTNEEVLAVNQDPLGQRAAAVSRQGLLEVWARNLRGGSKAVALFNRGTTDQPMSVTWAALGMTGMPRVRDVWRRSDFAATTTGISTTVPYRGGILFVVSPEGPMDGGSRPDGAPADSGSPDADDASRDGPSEAADAGPPEAATPEPRPSDASPADGFSEASPVDGFSDVSRVDSSSDVSPVDSRVDDSATNRDGSSAEAGSFDAGSGAPGDSSSCSCSLGSRAAPGAGTGVLLAMAAILGAARRARRRAYAGPTALAWSAVGLVACDPNIVEAVGDSCLADSRTTGCDGAAGVGGSDADLDAAAGDVLEATIADARGSDPVDAEGGFRAALIHRYSFEGFGTDAIDSVGGPAGNGRIVNSSLTGSGAVVLAGGRTGQYVELPRFLLHDLTSVTFEAWVNWNGYLDTAGNPLHWQRIFDFGQGLSSVPGEQAPSGTTATSYLFLTPRTEARTAAEVRDGRVQLRVAYQRPNSPQSVDFETQAHHTAPLPSGVECHVAVTVDDQTHTMSLFLNGSRVAVSPPDMQNVDLRYVYDVNNWLGRSQFAVDDGFAGSISEFRMYSIALTVDQIKASYDAGKDAILRP